MKLDETYTEPIHDFPLPNELATELISETPWVSGEISTFPKTDKEEKIILKNKTK